MSAKAVSIRSGSVWSESQPDGVVGGAACEFYEVCRIAGGFYQPVYTVDLSRDQPTDDRSRPTVYVCASVEVHSFCVYGRWRDSNDTAIESCF